MLQIYSLVGRHSPLQRLLACATVVASEAVPSELATTNIHDAPILSHGLTSGRRRRSSNAE
jgi:hypothetical protein